MMWYFNLLIVWIYQSIDWKEISARYVSCVELFLYPISMQSIHTFLNYITKSKCCVKCGHECISLKPLFSCMYKNHLQELNLISWSCSCKANIPRRCDKGRSGQDTDQPVCCAGQYTQIDCFRLIGWSNQGLTSFCEKWFWPLGYLAQYHDKGIRVRKLKKHLFQPIKCI